jgi:hypothetical protein
MKINQYGELVQNELWNPSFNDIDEEDVYEDGEECAIEGGTKEDNPWPKDSVAYNTWLDGFESI